MSFTHITKFENEVASFFGSPYAVAVDCCTHGLELCLRQQEIKHFTVSIYTENNIGLLNRISAIFQRRHINIESLNTSISAYFGC